jgi:hypothetical protein
MATGWSTRRGWAVVVPHRAQRTALQQALPQLAPRDPNTGLLVGSAIDTVERFQGGERRAILVRATESDPDYLRSAGELLLDQGDLRQHPDLGWGARRPSRRGVGEEHSTSPVSSTALLAAAACTCSYDADDPGAVR